MLLRGPCTLRYYHSKNSTVRAADNKQIHLFFSYSSNCLLFKKPLSILAVKPKLTDMSEHRTYSLGFYGKGMEYFKIQIVNTILSILTLSLYYPWAKEKSLKYLYNKNTFEGTPFVFTGTGREMFKGYVKALAILVVLYGISFYLILN